MSVITARPVVSRIESELFDRLNRLTAGYSDYLILTEVVRPKRLGDYTIQDRQIVLTREGEAERVPELDCPGNPPADAHRQVFAIRCHVLPSEKDDTPDTEYRDLIAAEVRKAVCDTTRWWTFGELAINAEWLDPQTIVSDGSYSGVAVMLAVIYRTDEGNPYNVRA